MLRSTTAIVVRRATVVPPAAAAGSGAASAAAGCSRALSVLAGSAAALPRPSQQQQNRGRSEQLSFLSDRKCFSVVAFKATNTAASKPTTPAQQRQRQLQLQRSSRHFSSYVFDGFSGGGGGGGGGGGSVWQWPVTKANTVFNIVPQGYRYVVERFGKLRSIEESGWFIAIPFIDQISYVIDVRERALDIPPQSAITRDNVSVEVSGNLFVRFQDPEKAAYGALNPLYSVTQHAQSAMRSAIGEMELDEILHGRAKLNALIRGSLQEASEPWGLEIRRYEITEITPDQQIRIAMDKQAAAERDRREQVLRAEGQKRRAELESEGVKISLTNESEGNLIRVQNEAEATKTKILLEAKGQADAVRLIADAQAEALRKISAELQKPGGLDAAQLSVAREYVSMYGEMGKQSNTILFNDRPADVSALMAQAMTAITATNQAATASATESSKKAIEAGSAPSPPPKSEEKSTASPSTST